jgi:hypothetical protein
MVLEQAGWHGALAGECRNASRLSPLPPYSPELNPVVWEYMFLSLRLLNDYDAITQAVCKP